VKMANIELKKKRITE